MVGCVIGYGLAEKKRCLHASSYLPPRTPIPEVLQKKFSPDIDRMGRTVQVQSVMTSATIFSRYYFTPLLTESGER